MFTLLNKSNYISSLDRIGTITKVNDSYFTIS